MKSLSMKNFLMCSAIAMTAGVIGLCAAVAPARADANAPFCIDGGGGGGGLTQGRVCNFYTLAQCQETVRGIAGSCIPNPERVNNSNARYRERSVR